VKNTKLINMSMTMDSPHVKNINNKTYFTNSEDVRDTNFMSQDINRVSDNNAKQTTASVFSS
jgi:hypothetical protein